MHNNSSNNRNNNYNNSNTIILLLIMIIIIINLATCAAEGATAMSRGTLRAWQSRASGCHISCYVLLYASFGVFVSFCFNIQLFQGPRYQYAIVSAHVRLRHLTLQYIIVIIVIIAIIMVIIIVIMIVIIVLVVLIVVIIVIIIIVILVLIKPCHTISYRTKPCHRASGCQYAFVMFICMFIIISLLLFINIIIMIRIVYHIGIVEYKSICIRMQSI